MLVTTATVGDSNRKVPSLSSASATRISPRPICALPASDRTRPPMTRVGSISASVSTWPIIDVVVVLPWLPATAMPYFMRMSSASISARGITGICRSLAASTSGFENFTAVEITTTESASARFAASWPMWTSAPSERRRRVASFSFKSEPLIS